MRKTIGTLVVTMIFLAGACAGNAQTVAGSQASAGGGGVPGASGHPPGQPASVVAAPDPKLEKQKALAMQTERLFAMATELKAQVDKTNKNILSLKVVEKAEEIEALAKGMRGQAKK